MTVWRDRDICSAIWGNDRWVASIGSRRSSAAVSADAPGAFWTAQLGQLGAERFGLADEGSEAGLVPEQLIDLPDERPGTCQVGKRDTDVSQLDPCLDGEVRQSVGQLVPHSLSTDELLARGEDVSPVQGCPGVHRAEQGRHEALLEPGPAQHGACLSGEGLGLGPFVACHRHQRPFAERGGEASGPSAFSPPLTAS